MSVDVSEPGLAASRLTRRAVLGAAWDAWRVARGGRPVIARRQVQRLAALIEFARTRSRFYRRRYEGWPAGADAFSRLPPVTKPELMASFDDWVTDAAVTRAGVEAFMADPARAGQPYLGRYFVWTSSGVTGVRGAYVADGNSLALDLALVGIRGPAASLRLRHLLAIGSRGGRRTAVLISGGGHYAGAVFQSVASRLRVMSPTVVVFDVTAPLHDLAPALNRFDPTTLIGYPTIMTLLADEQAAGRLRIRPVLIATGGETLTAAARRHVIATFKCLLRDTYGTSEFGAVAFDCGRGWLHQNADWVVLEPVDADYRPVPPGETSRTVLLTSLANRIQPFIRYDLGDSVTVSPEPCPCGSPFPAIRVEGRRNDILTLRDSGGEPVRLLPMALMEAMSRSAIGLGPYQLIQTGPASLKVRLEAPAGLDPRRVWDDVDRHLSGFLAAQGLADVRIERAQEPPAPDPSGKFRRVWAEVAAEGATVPERGRL